MTEHPSAGGQPRWQAWIEAYTARFQGPGIPVRQMLQLWSLSFLLVIVACAVFFLPLIWLFG
ncbi:hypothetical protein SAMN04515671_1906 [Nakamurella panacisegetis]|uniref:Uncharacterized protein n=1 Tax=Nakamurella panacisegetis TaxID=1090615 RepID=A0A1H0M325_9ACTN|nr:hypothetical protein [Nakamurella panacisegetis]SDO74616.1 hypothetical protein SAMN04515671_1906 [Nakamurella panacisegetis]